MNLSKLSERAGKALKTAQKAEASVDFAYTPRDLKRSTAARDEAFRDLFMILNTEDNIAAEQDNTASAPPSEQS